ncbi:hypothetical protein AAVH_19905 [Aphelenchoides avenae]|nr:hypothetical protein AAVH_19905 [Aphelenchus avenae]
MKMKMKTKMRSEDCTTLLKTMCSFVAGAQPYLDYVHIGLRYNSTAQQWQWADGRASTFTYWKTGSPTSPTDAPCARMCLTNENCVIGKWENLYCAYNSNTAVVCERETGEYE